MAGACRGRVSGVGVGNGSTESPDRAETIVCCDAKEIAAKSAIPTATLFHIFMNPILQENCLPPKDNGLMAGEYDKTVSGIASEC